MTAAFCASTADRKAETWEAQPDPFPRPEFAASDAAEGIAAAVEQVAEGRRGSERAPALEHGPDVFPTVRGAHAALARQRRQAESAWAEAETADAEVDRAQGRGIDARGPAGPARAAWREAAAAPERAGRLEKARRRARAAPELFRLDGRLNDRADAGAEIAAAGAGLPGPEWEAVRNFLLDPRSLAFLDRMHQRLATAEPRPEWREATAWRRWLRHRRPVATANPSTGLVHAVARQRPSAGREPASYGRVAAVLRGTVRARSAVGCMDSVLRIQQPRHRRMTRPMLDLKRLYWDSHPFRSGPRNEACPYRTLGLGLPTYDLGELLQANPAELTQELSTQGNAM